MMPSLTVNDLYIVTDGILCRSCLLSCNSVDFNPFNSGYWTFSRCCAKFISISESSWPIMIASSQNFLCLFLGGDCSTSRLLSVKSTVGSFSTRLMDTTAVGMAGALSTAALTVSS